MLKMRELTEVNICSKLRQMYNYFIIKQILLKNYFFNQIKKSF